MSLAIVPYGEGFQVQWLASGKPEGEPIVTVNGFPTMAAAESFVQDLLVKVMNSRRRVN